MEKVEGPATTLRFLGVEIDTAKMEIRLPEDKLQRIRQELITWLGRKLVPVAVAQRMGRRINHGKGVSTNHPKLCNLGSQDHQSKSTNPVRQPGPCHSHLKRLSRDKDVMRMLRCLWFLVAYFNIDLHAKHIAGMHNTTANQLSKIILFSSSGISAANPTPITTSTDSVIPQTGLDIATLQHSIQGYYRLGSAHNTWKTYSAGIRHYTKFCNLINKPTLPTTECTLLLFVAHLASLNLPHATINVYLSGLRSLHVTHGHHTAFNSQLTTRLQQVFKGIRKQQATGLSPRICRPITIQIMAGIKSILLKNPHEYHNIMMWTACCLAFFGFLRSSEFTVPSQGTCPMIAKFTFH